MSITQVNVSSPSGEIVFTDTAMGNTADAIKASSALVFSCKVDNSANASAVYVKIFNLAAGSVVVGTTAPDEIIYVPGLKIITTTFWDGAAFGKTFASALSAFCVTTGGTAGTSSPGSSVIVSVSYV